MIATLQKPWTRAQFFAWADTQEGRYEFDGTQPVAMVGGTNNHSFIRINIIGALHPRLRGTECRVAGPDAGVATIGQAVRYPDALITCASADGTARLMPGPVIVFEVLSPNSGRLDRIIKVREYAAVPSILRYVILEYTGIAATVLSRPDGDTSWTATTLTENDHLAMPEAGITVPLTEFYDNIAFDQAEA